MDYNCVQIHALRRSLASQLLDQRMDRLITHPSRILHDHRIDRTLAKILHHGIARVECDQRNFIRQIAGFDRERRPERTRLG